VSGRGSSYVNHQSKQTHAQHRGRPRLGNGLDTPAAEAGAAKIGAYTLKAPVSIVTAPVSAKALPHRILALVFMVMLWSARMLPAKVVLVPRVAELPTSQNTPLLAPPLITLIVAPLAVVRVLQSERRRGRLDRPGRRESEFPSTEPTTRTYRCPE
jgi:hypothetical protein